jgi:rRNA-processing protein FCF1
VDGATIEHRYLRSALQFAVTMAAEWSRQRHPTRPPAALKPYLKMARLPTGALGAVRRTIEADDAFRERVAEAAVPEVVDEIGMLWLRRPEGWLARVGELVTAAVAAAEAEAAVADHRREQRRREAAEQAVARSRADLLELQDRLGALIAELDAARAESAALADTVDTLRAELAAARTEARHANDRAAAAAEKLDRLRSERDDARQQTDEALGVRDEALADRAASNAEVARLAALAAAAQALADELAELGTPTVDSETRRAIRTARRRALALPGGVVNDSSAATEFLLRSGATVLVDGYNVAKLQWPHVELADQRRVLLDAAENTARRFGADLTVVFDGADVVGATGDPRRLVRVVYSPEGITADDVIRAEVSRLPPHRQVVVVTNDAAIIRDVRQQGANTVSSDRFAAVACR